MNYDNRIACTSMQWTIIFKKKYEVCDFLMKLSKRKSEKLKKIKDQIKLPKPNEKKSHINKYSVLD